MTFKEWLSKEAYDPFKDPAHVLGPAPSEDEGAGYNPEEDPSHVFYGHYKVRTNAPTAGRDTTSVKMGKVINLGSKTAPNTGSTIIDKNALPNMSTHMPLTHIVPRKPGSQFVA